MLLKDLHRYKTGTEGDYSFKKHKLLFLMRQMLTRKNPDAAGSTEYAGTKPPLANKGSRRRCGLTLATAEDGVDGFLAAEEAVDLGLDGGRSSSDPKKEEDPWNFSEILSIADSSLCSAMARVLLAVFSL
jgi:hypothetical protein